MMTQPERSEPCDDAARYKERAATDIVKAFCILAIASFLFFAWIAGGQATRVVLWVAHVSVSHPDMSDGEIAAILRALGSTETGHPVEDERRVRSLKANGRAVPSTYPEADLIHLTPVPERLLDLKIGLKSDVERTWLSRSELSTIKSPKR